MTAGNGSILSMHAQIRPASDRRYPDRPGNGERALCITAQAALAVVVIGYVISRLDLGLLDLARDVAAFNVPAKVGHVFGTIL